MENSRKMIMRRKWYRLILSLAGFCLLFAQPCARAFSYAESDGFSLDISKTNRGWADVAGVSLDITGPYCGSALNAYPVGDISHDCSVDLVDFAMLGGQWAQESCAEPAWCQWADLNHDGKVGLTELAWLAEGWLADTWPGD